MSASDTSTGQSSLKLVGGQFAVAVIFIALANFLAVMNMTIANVALPTIAGNLGISTSQGNWVITFYAVAEAITVPLTGWFSARFGAIRVFCTAFVCFGIASGLCGLSGTFSALVIARLLQGFSGGLLMPLSQTLLLRIFPDDKSALATALWSVTTLTAPVVGPILGGYLCDNYTWHWAFYINTILSLAGSIVLARVLWKGAAVDSVKATIDKVGLFLLVFWVASLQVMLDEGKNKDWFASDEICILAVAAVIGFIAFLIWELTEKNPIVNLRVFKHRGYTAAVLTLMIAFGAFFGINVLIPQWLQVNMGYTATWSGKTVAWMGVLAVMFAPVVAGLTSKIDTRLLTFLGVGWIGLTALWLTLGNSQMTYWDVSIPFLFMGLGLPLYLVPVSAIALSSVGDDEMEGAAGVMNFLRTMAGAFFTSLTTTMWDNSIKYNRAELVSISSPSALNSTPVADGTPQNVAINLFSMTLDSQSVMLATNRTLFILALVLFGAAITIFLAPKQTRVVDTSKVH